MIHGILGMQGEHAEAVVHAVAVQVGLIALFLIRGGAELQVVPGLALQALGHVGAQDHLQLHALGGGRSDQIVAQGTVRGAAEGHRDGDGVGVSVTGDAASAGGRGGVPLLRRGQKVQITVGGDTDAVEGHLDTAHVLVAERTRERVVVHEDVKRIRSDSTQVVVAGDLHEAAGLGVRC